MSDHLYLRAPIGEKDGVPIFSQFDDYVVNYATIAKAHLDHLTTVGTNPFMDSVHIDKVHHETIRFIKQVCDAPVSVLDVGVGLGGLIAPLDIEQKFGVDVSLEYLSKAQTRGITVAMSKIEELPYVSGRFDLVTCTDVLEHVFDYMRCIFQIARVTKPGGTVIVRVPYKENLDVYRESPQFDFVHVRNFDLSALRLHFESLMGLEYLAHQTIGEAYRGWKTSIFEDLILNKDKLEGWAKIAEQAGAARAMDLVNPAQFEIEDVMNELSMHAPEAFDKAVSLLNRPVEICVAFRRPDESSALERSPLGRNYRTLLEPGAAIVQASVPLSDNAYFAAQIAVLEREMRRLQVAQEKVFMQVSDSSASASAGLLALTETLNKWCMELTEAPEKRNRTGTMSSKLGAKLRKLMKQGRHTP